MPKEESQNNIEFYLPVNYDKTGKFFMGLLDTWKTVQTLTIVGPLAALVIVAPLQIVAKFLLAMFILIPLLIVGMIGYNGLGLWDIIIQSFNYLKEKHYYSFKKIEYTEVNNGEESEIWSRRRSNRNKASKKKKKSKNS